MREVPFFGMALDDYLKPDRLILVGTSGSMWDVFFEAGRPPERRIPARTHRGGRILDVVDTSLLQSHAGHLAERLGHPVDCLLIDYARDPAGQARLLGQLAASLTEGEHIAMDVTHFSPPPHAGPGSPPAS